VQKGQNAALSPEEAARGDAILTLWLLVRRSCVTEALHCPLRDLQPTTPGSTSRVAPPALTGPLPVRRCFRTGTQVIPKP
jgi:hypothetical protein